MKRLFWKCTECNGRRFITENMCTNCHGTGYELNHIGVAFFAHLGKCIEEAMDNFILSDNADRFIRGR